LHRNLFAKQPFCDDPHKRLLRAEHVDTDPPRAVGRLPSAANTMIKTMRQLFRFSVRCDLHDTNPAAHVE
jgi:site-specific recombinase XerD